MQQRSLNWPSQAEQSAAALATVAPLQDAVALELAMAMVHVRLWGESRDGSERKIELADLCHTDRKEREARAQDKDEDFFFFLLESQETMQRRQRRGKIEIEKMHHGKAGPKLKFA